MVDAQGQHCRSLDTAKATVQICAGVYLLNDGVWTFSREIIQPLNIPFFGLIARKASGTPGPRDQRRWRRGISVGSGAAAVTTVRALLTSTWN